MGKLRCPALAAGLLLLTCREVPPVSEAAGGVEVRVGERPGELEILNSGKGAVSILSAITIEQRGGAVWKPIATSIQAIQSCPAAGQECQSVPEGARWKIAAWSGFSCAAQCPEPCRANNYYGPGEFRFLVRSCDRRSSWTSGTFRLPAEPPKGR